MKIADFGIAKLAQENPESLTLTGTGSTLGTLHYMAPEQCESPAEVDHRADIYSLGVVFYEMLTGELPLGRFAPPSSMTPVGTAVDDVVFRALEKDPNRRFQTASEVKTKVEHLNAQGFGPVPSSKAGRPGVHSPGISWLRPSKIRWALAGLGLAGILALSLALPKSRSTVTRMTRGGNQPASMGDAASLGQANPTAPWLRITFVSVDYREDDDGSWLTFDFAEDVHGNCQRGLAYESLVPGFTPRTRTTSIATSPRGGSPGVQHQRVEFLVPPQEHRTNLLALRKRLSEEFVPKSVVLSIGDRHPLFSLPMTGGSFSTWVTAVDDTPSTTARSADIEQAVSKSREKLEWVQQRYQAGLVPLLEVAAAERDLAIAEALNDPLAQALANVKFEERSLEEATQRHAAGVVSKLRVIEAETRLAQARHAVAVAMARSNGDPVQAARADLDHVTATLANARKHHEAGLITEDRLREAENDVRVAQDALNRAIAGRTFQLNERRAE